MLELSGLIFAAYFAAGRTGAIATCLFLGIAVWETLIIAILIDFLQIPFYGLMIEASQKYVVLPERFQTWVKRRFKKFQDRLEVKGFLNRLSSHKPLAVLAVSTIPFRGLGIFSACILSVMLGYSRSTGTFLIMLGSLIGSVLSILFFFLPARWLGGL